MPRGYPRNLQQGQQNIGGVAQTVRRGPGRPKGSRNKTTARTSIQSPRARSAAMTVGVGIGRGVNRGQTVPSGLLAAGAVNSSANRYRYFMQKIRLLTNQNPKRQGTLSFDRFGLYRNGMTVGEYLEAGGRPNDLWWDRGHGFIEIIPAGQTNVMH